MSSGQLQATQSYYNTASKYKQKTVAANGSNIVFAKRRISSEDYDVIAKKGPPITLSHLNEEGVTVVT